MNADHLPSSVEELRELLLATHRRLELAEQQTAELATTIDTQREQLEKKDRQILELLQALRGKQRERVDPNQLLLLFEIGELEQLLEEQTADNAEATTSRRRRRKHSRRLIPENLPREEIVYELPEEERRCPIDGEPMPLIRYESSEQIEYEPATLKVIVHKRAVYACPQKHDEAKLITTPKPPQPIEKGLAGPGLLAAMVVGKFGRRSAVCWSCRFVAISERKLVQAGYAGSAIICRGIGSKIFSRGTVSRFDAARSTTDCPPSPISHSRFTT